MTLALPDHFWTRVQKSAGCWLWTGSLNTTGYGQFVWEKRTKLAHRLVYEELVAPIPAGMQLDHKCHTPACVNPSHLQAVTNQQNAENRAGAQANSASGVRGVWWRPERGRWRVGVRVKGVAHRGGLFVELADAEARAIALRNELMTNNLRDRGAA